MANIFATLIPGSDVWHIMKIIIIVILFLLVTHFVLKMLKKKLMSKARTKRQRSHIQISIKFLKYLIYFFILLFATISYLGSLKSLGVTVGILTAALGFALQRPITGVAAWLMVITKRPFEIGDRIVIGKIKGDVVDITITHIYLEEVGVFGEEEKSGRTVLIPNSKLFEEDIINYSAKDDFILGEVITSITYESNIDRAVKVIVDSAQKHLLKSIIASSKEPYIRMRFKDSSVDVIVRFMVTYQDLQEIKTNITKEIHKRIQKEKNVEIAYPHTEVIFRKK